MSYAVMLCSYTGQKANILVTELQRLKIFKHIKLWRKKLVGNVLFAAQSKLLILGEF